MVKSPEFASVVAFVQFCSDDDRSSFSHEDLQQLNYQTGLRIGDLRAELVSYGLVLAARVPPISTGSHRKLGTNTANKLSRGAVGGTQSLFSVLSCTWGP